MCAVVSSAFPQIHMVSPVYNFHFFSLLEVYPVQTVDTSVCGPWDIITFCQLFVKINDVYVRFIAQSLPPFAASKEVSRLYI